MPWVRFTEDHDFKLTPKATRAYKAGMECLVSQRCANEAIAAGKAVEIERKSEDASR